MKIKVSELTGRALDWAVAEAEGLHPFVRPKGIEVLFAGLPRRVPFSPSTDWAQGGPIIEREIFKLFKNVGGTFTAQIKKSVPYYSPTYDADIGISEVISCSGPTPLVAGMHCFVASRLGDEVEIPEELICQS